MTTTIAIVLFLVFLFLSFIHFYWGFGGRWGSDYVFPTKADNTKFKMPGVLPTLIVALGLLGIGFFVLIKSRLILFNIPLWLDNYGLWIIAGIFILRAIGEFNYVGFFKRIKQTKFGQNDTKYYSPLSFTIGILTLLMELKK
jgi:hypothetical protein